ncbi:MAG: proton-conducting transporter membrane subunit [Opitutaceae bacterium]|jgi:hydrogenase-4 component B
MTSTGPWLLLALLGVLAGAAASRKAPRLWLWSVVASSVLALGAALPVLAGRGEWKWQGGLLAGGEAVHLRLDGLSAFFLALVAVVGGAASVYSPRYWPDRAHPRSAPRGRFWWCILLLSMALVLLASNGLHFLIAWEVFVVSGYFLITLESQNGEVRKAGWLYLAASHAGTLCLVAFFATLSARVGSWDLGPMRDHAELAPLFWLVLFGFGMKAGFFPLHIWLPSAHANAPAHVSAIFSGVVIKMGIYGIIRFSGWLPVPGAAGWTVAGLGAVSAILGVVFALGQHDLKRLLAYHSVENIGIILLGLGFSLIATRGGHPVWGGLALAGALLHVWNHGLFKALLFLGAGAVVHATGLREMSRLGGLWRRMPWTTACFALGAAAISGLPPLNGFVSEWLVYLGLFGAADGRGAPSLAAMAAAVILAMTSALALACFIKATGVVFLGAARSKAAAEAHECGRPMLAAMGILAAACAAIGLAPAAFWPAVASAAGAWRGPWVGVEAPPSLIALGLCGLALALLSAGAAFWLWRRIWAGRVERAPTWGCGYAAISPRMQYTAGSLAATILEWFAWIIRPERREVRPDATFPARASLEERTPETVLEYVVLPAGALVMRASFAVRRLQHGRLPAYLFYIVAGVAGLAALVFFGRG